jgi:hypothetical protein
MRLSGVMFGLALVVASTPALAEQDAEHGRGSEVGQVEMERATVHATTGIESTVRRALDSLRRMRLHPGRDGQESANTARFRPTGVQ